MKLAGILAAFFAVTLAACADMDQCSLGLCAKACPAVNPTTTTTTGAGVGGGGGAGGGAVCNPQRSVTTGN